MQLDIRYSTHFVNGNLLNLIAPIFFSFAVTSLQILICVLNVHFG